MHGTLANPRHRPHFIFNPPRVIFSNTLLLSAWTHVLRSSLKVFEISSLNIHNNKNQKFGAKFTRFQQKFLGLKKLKPEIALKGTTTTLLNKFQGNWIKVKRYLILNFSPHSGVAKIYVPGIIHGMGPIWDILSLTLLSSHVVTSSSNCWDRNQC